MRILLVEDSKSLRLSMAETIKESGHTPLLAEDGQAALNMLSDQSVDLIFMDVEMPGMDGFETTRQARILLGDHWVPIIFLTGKNEDSSYVAGIDAGGDDYLIKPITPIILSAKISAMMRIINMRDELQALNQELEKLSQIDGLTQLYNHRTFIQRADEQWAQASRNGHAVSLLMLDIDHFKLFNDHYGHPTGDTCLKKVSKALTEVVKRPGDIVARYGGEEFIIFLPNTDAKGAEKVGLDIKQAISDLKIPHESSPTDSVVTASIGVSVCDSTTARRLNDMIKHADVLLYDSKNKGRNQVSVEQYLPTKTIVLTDDDPFILKVISSQIGSHCRVITAKNGQECIDVTKEVKPDLILMDILMPKMDGLEACKILKEDSKTSHIPVILISKIDDSTKMKEIKQSGANAYLDKPIEELRLLSKINHFLT